MAAAAWPRWDSRVWRCWRCWRQAVGPPGPGPGSRSGCRARPSPPRSSASPVRSGVPPGFTRGPVIGVCRPDIGPRRGVHVEIFAANRVVLIAAGIGARPPFGYAEGRIAAAACYGSLVTLEPTGVVLVRGGPLTLSAVFRSWGQPLSPHRLASFAAGPGSSVAVWVDGRRWVEAPGAVPLRRHAEIVLEVGPHVPPHSHYTFPPGA
jgi:hypothetical protein